MRDRLRRDLTEAMKARDSVAVAALRSAIAAIDNAGAVDVASDQTASVGSEHFAGAVAGLGAAEAPRRNLSEAEIEAIVAAQVRERLEAAERYDALGEAAGSERLRGEAAVLSNYL